MLLHFLPFAFVSLCYFLVLLSENVNSLQVSKEGSVIVSQVNNYLKYQKFRKMKNFANRVLRKSETATTEICHLTLPQLLTLCQWIVTNAVLNDEFTKPIIIPTTGNRCTKHKFMLKGIRQRRELFMFDCPPIQRHQNLPNLYDQPPTYSVSGSAAENSVLVFSTTIVNDGIVSPIAFASEIDMEKLQTITIFEPDDKLQKHTIDEKTLNFDSTNMFFDTRNTDLTSRS